MKMKVTKTINLDKSTQGLLIPTTVEQYTPILNFNYVQFTHWLTELPIANINETAKMLFLAFTELNKSNLTPIEKFKLAESSRQMLHQTVLSLSKHYTDQSKELSLAKLKIADLAQTLHLEFSYIYKSIITALLAQKNYDTTILATALYRAIYFSMLMIFRNYQLYRTHDNNVWQEIGIIYELAVSLQLHNINVGTVYKTHDLPRTTENCFKHILLLGTINLYQWRTHEQSNVHIAINDWINLIELRKIQSSDKNKPFIYGYNIALNKEPMLINNTNFQDLKNGYTIDLTPISTKLEQQSVVAHDINPLIQSDIAASSYLSTFFINQLITHWSTDDNLNLQKPKTPAAYNIALGLPASHYHISNRTIFNPSSEGSITVEIDKNINKNDDDKQDDSNNNNNDETNTLEQQFQIKHQPDIDKNQLKKEFFPLYVGFLRSETSDYLQLRYHSKAHPAIQAGDLVALSSTTTSPNQWFLGKIKTLKYHQPHELDILIQRIYPEAKITPVGCAVFIEQEQASEDEETGNVLEENQTIDYNLKAQESSKEKHKETDKDDRKSKVHMFARCLLLQHNNETILCTPFVPFKTDQKVCIKTIDKHDKILKLTDEINISTTFKIFRFKTKQRKQSDQKSQQMNQLHNTKDLTDLVSEFDSIWDDI